MKAQGSRTREAERSRTFGQGLVEFALILPVMLMLIFVIIELGRVLHAWLSVENAARFAIRYAVTSEYIGAYCAGGEDDKGACLNEADVPAARVLSIKDVANAGSSGILSDPSVTDWSMNGYFKVTVCALPLPPKYTPSDQNNWVTDWTAQCVGGNDPGEEGQRVAVTVDFNHPLITPFLSSAWPQLHLTSRRDGIVESFRTVRYVGFGAYEATEAIYSPVPTQTPTETPTVTSTATETSTPTPTATPDCSKIYFTTGLYRPSDDSRLRAQIQNDNPVDFELQHTRVEWPPMPGIIDELNYLLLDSSTYWPGNDSSSPTDRDETATLPANKNVRWVVDFNPGPILGDFAVELTFGLAGWSDTCTIDVSINLSALPTDTPTLTPTYGPSPTATKTPTKTQTPTNGPSPTRTPTKTATKTRTPTKTATSGPPPTATTPPTATSPAGPSPTFKPPD